MRCQAKDTPSQRDALDSSPPLDGPSKAPSVPQEALGFAAHLFARSGQLRKGSALETACLQGGKVVAQIGHKSRSKVAEGCRQTRINTEGVPKCLGRPINIGLRCAGIRLFTEEKEVGPPGLEPGTKGL